jgi:DNA-binding MarR family transcriptional regulator
MSQKDEDSGLGNHELAMRLRSAYLAMHRRANDKIARFGFTADQFVIVGALADGGGSTQKELVQRSGSDPITISEMLGRLERRGLIPRRRADDDRGAGSVSLTQRGLELQSRAWGDTASCRRALAAMLSQRELNALAYQLGRMVAAQSVELPIRSNGWATESVNFDD